VTARVVGLVMIAAGLLLGTAVLRGAGA